MATPIARLMSEVKTKLLEPSLTSQYLVEIFPPNGPGAPKIGLLNQDILNLSCSETSLPGSALLTHEMKDDHVGVTEKIAYRKTYDDTASFTFYVSLDYTTIRFFEDWIRYISGESLVGLTFGTPDTQTFNHRMQFKKNYQSTMYINKFEKDYGKGEYTGNEQRTYLQYKFFETYPSSINSMPVSYDGSQLLKCTVNFTFTRYLLRLVPYGNANENPSLPALVNNLRAGNIRLADGTIFQSVSAGAGDINLGARDVERII